MPPPQAALRVLMTTFLWQEEAVCELVNHQALIVPRKGIKEVGNVFSAAPAPAVSLPAFKRKRRLSG